MSYQKIYNLEIFNRRATKIVEGEKTLWDFANLYFQPRNAMLYYLKDRKDEIAIICVKKSILKKSNIFITTGNAAHNESQIIRIGECQEILPKIRDEIDKEWWNAEDGSKRKMMAECLVPDLVPATTVHSYIKPARETQDITPKKPGPNLRPGKPPRRAREDGKRLPRLSGEAVSGTSLSRAGS
ncbi:MAG: DUF4433 domain-containing protein [Hormoscilla sp. GM102CHS1]|nr:DUF4433 domain-containing protein [Hormoscilla sp. GM102CHS1]